MLLKFQEVAEGLLLGKGEFYISYFRKKNYLPDKSHFVTTRFNAGKNN